MEYFVHSFRGYSLDETWENFVDDFVQTTFHLEL